MFVAAGRFDLDHVGAMIGEHLRRQRAAQHARQIEDSHTGQRTFAGGAFPV